MGQRETERDKRDDHLLSDCYREAIEILSQEESVLGLGGRLTEYFRSMD